LFSINASSVLRKYFSALYAGITIDTEGFELIHTSVKTNLEQFHFEIALAAAAADARRAGVSAIYLRC
jgi:hypothetical protein